MKIFLKILIVCILFICIVAQTGMACTTFCLNQGDVTVFGRNFDWTAGHGSVFINKKGVTRKAKHSEFSEPFVWESKFGSATFNQKGFGLPYCGMNEAGLVVETMMLSDTVYPQSPDPRPEIGLFQWIQYQLDNFSTIKEVIASNSQIRIKDHIGAHFLVCDGSGECVTIEFLNGKPVYHTREKLPVKVLSNSPYSEAVKFWRKGQPPGNDRRRSIGRFILAANMVETYDPKTMQPVDYAFNILSKVANPSDTQWSIVYDIKNLGIYFKTKENRKIRYFSLKSFDFSDTSIVKVVDVNGNFSGEISGRFTDF